MFSSISNLSSPDGELESFWLSFKPVLNGLNEHSETAKKIINIEKWSSVLNEFCADKKYIEIEKQIEIYIIQSGWAFIKYANSYQFNLFVTHLKRWRNIATLCTTLNKNGKHKREYFKHINDRLFDIYIDILDNMKSNSELFNTKIYKTFIESIPIPNYDDLDGLENTYLDLKKLLYNILQSFITDKRERCIEITFEYIDMVEYVMNHYNIKLTHKTSPRKLLLLIDKHKTTSVSSQDTRTTIDAQATDSIKNTS